MGFTSMISSFTAGEFSRRLDGRTDFERYFSGARKLRNCTVMPHGGATRRSGTRLLYAAKHAEKLARLIPFDFNASEGQSYRLEFGDQYIRVLTSDGPVLSGGSPYEISTPFTEAQLRGVRFKQIGDIMYLVHAAHWPRILTRRDHDDWTLASVAFVDGPYLSPVVADRNIVITPSARTGSVALAATGGDAFPDGCVGAHFRLGYTDADDASALRWGWGKITARASATSCTLGIEEPLGKEYVEDQEFEVGIVGWNDKSTSPSAISYDAVNKRLVLTKSASGGYARAEFKVVVAIGETMTLAVEVAVVNTALRVYVGSSSGGTNVLGVQTLTATGVHSFTITPQYDEIYVTVDNNTGTAGDVDSLESVSLAKADLSTNEWRMGALSDSNGYPEDLTFFEGRLMLADGRTYYGSRNNGDFETFSFSTPPLDDDALSFLVTSAKVTSTQWMIDAEALLVGTNAGEFKFTTGTDGEPLSATQPMQPRRQSSWGSKALPALQAGSAIIYVSPTGRKVRQLSYDLTKYQYNSDDISQLAEHITKSGIVEIDYAPEPDGVLWAVRGDGKVAACTYLPEEKVIAWHLHTLGGDGAVESVCVTPGTGYSEVTFLVRREVNGAVVRTIETLAEQFDGTDEPDAADYFGVDCGLSTVPVGAVSAATQASPVQITAVGHGLSTGDSVLLRDLGGMTELNVRTFTVTVLGADSFTLDGEDGTGHGRYTAGGEVWKRILTINLAHLEGETVDILVDGAVHAPRVVAAGVVTLDAPAGVVHAGLGFEALIQPMSIDIPTQGGTIQTKPKRIISVSARVLRSVGGQIGVGSEPTVWDSLYPAAPLPVGAPPLFTGDYKVTTGAGFSTDAIVTVRQAEPLPLTLLALVPEIGDV